MCVCVYVCVCLYVCVMLSFFLSLLLLLLDNSHMPLAASSNCEPPVPHPFSSRITDERLRAMLHVFLLDDDEKVSGLVPANCFGL